MRAAAGAGDDDDDVKVATICSAGPADWKQYFERALSLSHQSKRLLVSYLAIASCVGSHGAF